MHLAGLWQDGAAYSTVWLIAQPIMFILLGYSASCITSAKLNVNCFGWSGLKILLFCRPNIGSQKVHLSSLGWGQNKQGKSAMSCLPTTFHYKVMQQQGCNTLKCCSTHSIYLLMNACDYCIFRGVLWAKHYFCYHLLGYNCILLLQFAQLPGN